MVLARVITIALDRHAYRGAPYGVSHAWPDFVLHPSRWDKNSWNFDEGLKTRGRALPKPAFTRDTALTLLNKLLTK